MEHENLNRFLTAQELIYPLALKEIRSGRKKSHWMWYIFPQLKCLGESPTSKHYGIADFEEAKAYMAVPILRERLIEITRALLALEGNDPNAVFGYPDNLKLRSCMTLFEKAAPDVPEFGEVLDRFYQGSRDYTTLHFAKESPQTSSPDDD